MTGIILWKKIVGLMMGLFFAFLITGTVIACENEGVISAALGEKTFEIINNSNGTLDTKYYKSAYTNLADVIANSEMVAQRAETEGAVLLKNDNNTLPLTSGHRNVTLFGSSSTEAVYGGTGSGSVNTSTAPTFKTAMEASGFTINGVIWDYYLNSNFGRKSILSPSGVGSVMAVNEAPWSEVSAAGLESFSTYGDAAIVVLGRVGGEGSDMLYRDNPDPDVTDGNYLKLTQNEIALLTALAALKGTTFDSIIVLLNTANQIETSFLNDPAYKIDAALWIGGVGQVGLFGVADILAGNVNPSGHLCDTFWQEHSENPVMANFGVYEFGNQDLFDLSEISGPSYTNYVVYQEGIYLGYRYTETRYEDVVMGAANAGTFNYNNVVSYPFGFGLSYTEFEFSNFTVNKSGSTYTASVTVTNVGDVAGKDAVQFYVQKPYTDYDVENKIEKASVDLVEFGKTDILDPNESQVITVDIDEQLFTSYDAWGAGTYILDEGTYYITAAHDCHDAVNNILTDKGYGVSDGMTAEGNAAMVKSFDLGFSDTKFSKSDATNAVITNLFDEADVNRNDVFGDQTVTYLSRNNWSGTLNLTNNVQLNISDEIIYALFAQKLDPTTDDIQYPLYGIDSGLKLIDMRVDSLGNPISFNDPVWDKFMDQLTWEETTYLISTGFRRTGAIESIAKPETLDHNGPSGLTLRFGSGSLGLASLTDDPLKDSTPMCYPSNGIIAATFNKDLANAVGDSIGEEGLWAGFSGLYGTGANVHRSAYEGRAFEYYSEDPILGGKIISEESAGIQSHGVYVYLKHFVLNEQEANRQGINTMINEQTMREIYLPHFQIPIEEGGVKNVMASFNRIGLIIAPMSDAALNGFLRNEVGLTGFVVTDFYLSYGDSMNRAQSIMNGCDLPDGNPNSNLLDVYANDYGALANDMRESAKRILYTVVHSNAMNGFSSDTTIVQLTPIWLSVLISLDVIFGVAFAGVSLLMITDLIKKARKY